MCRASSRNPPDISPRLAQTLGQMLISPLTTLPEVIGKGRGIHSAWLANPHSVDSIVVEMGAIFPCRVILDRCRPVLL